MQDLFLWEENELKRKDIAVRVFASIMAAVMSLTTESGTFCMTAFAAEDDKESTADEMAAEPNANVAECPCGSEEATVTDVVEAETLSENQTEVQADEALARTDSLEIPVETADTDFNPVEVIDTPEGVAVFAETSAESDTGTATDVADTTATTVTTDNEDGTKTTVTTTTETEYTPGTSVTTEINEGDSDYHRLEDENGVPVLDENGNEQWSYEKKETTGDSTKTTTTTQTTVTKETTETHKDLTNADNYSDKTVYTVGADGSKEKAQDDEAGKVKDFLTSLNVTSDFVIYANTLSGTCGHEDGNIAVGELDKSTTVMNKEQYGPDEINKDYALDGYTYIGKTGDGAEVTTSSNQTEGSERSTLVTGDGSDVTVNVTEESGTANHFDRVNLGTDSFDETGELKPDAIKDVVSDHPELEDLGSVIKIGDNLNEIAGTGEAITSVYEEADDRTTDEDTAAIKATAALLDETDESGEKILGSGDIISLTVGINTLTSGENDNDYNNGKYLTQLINRNTNGVDIVINILIGDGADEGASVTINKIMNDIDDYDSRAAYLVWNFGDYQGTININGTFSGVIVAPKALVKLSEIQSGRAVADDVSHMAEVHMAVRGSYETSTVTSVETLSDEVSSFDEIKTGEGTVVYLYRGKKADTLEIPDSKNEPEDKTSPSGTESTDKGIVEETLETTDDNAIMTEPDEPVLPDNAANQDVTEVNVVNTVTVPDRNVSTGDESDLVMYGSVAVTGAIGLFMWLIMFLKRKKH